MGERSGGDDLETVCLLNGPLRNDKVVRNDLVHIGLVERRACVRSENAGAGRQDVHIVVVFIDVEMVKDCQMVRVVLDRSIENREVFDRTFVRKTVVNGAAACAGKRPKGLFGFIAGRHRVVRVDVVQEFTLLVADDVHMKDLVSIKFGISTEFAVHSIKFLSSR